MNAIYLNIHLGLGDALICNGLVRCLLEEHGIIFLPHWSRNRESLRAMLFDIIEDGRVKLIEVDSTGEPKEQALLVGVNQMNLGYHGKDFDKSRWDESFYRQAEVPFLLKWGAFDLPTSLSLNPSIHDVPKFIHDDEKRGFNIPLEGHRPTPVLKCIFDHVHELMAAKEIHCINSSFAILADLINAPGERFLHRYARPDGGALPIFGQHWTILDRPL